jgi:hypothetical protein
VIDLGEAFTVKNLDRVLTPDFSSKNRGDEKGVAFGLGWRDFPSCRAAWRDLKFSSSFAKADGCLPFFFCCFGGANRFAGAKLKMWSRVAVAADDAHPPRVSPQSSFTAAVSSVLDSTRFQIIVKDKR